MQKNTIIYISAFVILAVFLLGAGYFLGGRRDLFQRINEEPEAIFSSDLEAGSVGEVLAKEIETGKESPLVTPTMPPAIFGTAGIIKEVKSDRVVIRSNGTHFADGIARDVTVIFTAETSTFVSSQSFKWKGFSGLDHLKADMKIIVESRLNIRGKTEFKVKNINII